MGRIVDMTQPPPLPPRPVQPSNSPFRYQTPLYGSRVSQTVRLIHLYPEKGYSPLACSLRHVSLHDDPQFDAISYCWGTQEPTRAILCNGSPLWITQNLHDALCQFRSPTHEVSLWADAICINQADPEEKNEQVPLMGSIYGRASNVKVWLGRDEGYAESTKAAVTELVRLQRYHAAKHNIPPEELYVPTSESWARAMNGATVDLDKHAGAFLRLVGNPYFSRAWVIQEVALSRGRAQLYSGSTTFPWLDFVDALFFAVHCDVANTLMSSKDKAMYRALNRVAALAQTTAVVRASGGKGVGMLWLLHTNRSAAATDPRDKVYAILGLANNEDPGGGPTALFITPDYRIDTAVLFQQVAEKFLARFPQLSILSGAGNFGDDNERIPGLPSWVHDWSHATMSVVSLTPDIDNMCERGQTAGFNACLSNQYPKVYRVDGKTLWLSGFAVDEVVEAAALFDVEEILLVQQHTSVTEASMLLLRNLKQAANMWQVAAGRAYVHTGEEYVEAFLKAIFLQNVPEAYYTTAIVSALRKILTAASWGSLLSKTPLGGTRPGMYMELAAFAIAMAQTSMPAVAQRQVLVRLIMQSLSNKVVLRTRHGYMALAYAAGVAPGDRLALVRGGYAPLVLRPRSDGLWTLISDGFAYGMMGGERFDITQCMDMGIA
ncbi:hypothetical protein S40293_07612 [Stachybotrys chartarum IBT 40293]|nr:hypothetical protein S40293_07612 [Stachybotrys chartarum IBT 40293]